MKQCYKQFRGKSMPQTTGQAFDMKTATAPESRGTQAAAGQTF